MNNIKFLRKEAGMGQQELAQLVEVSRESIRLIENGKTDPSVTLALKISRALCCTVEHLFVLPEDVLETEGPALSWDVWRQQVGKHINKVRVSPYMRRLQERKKEIILSGDPRCKDCRKVIPDNEPYTWSKDGFICERCVEQYGITLTAQEESQEESAIERGRELYADELADLDARGRVTFDKGAEWENRNESMCFLKYCKNIGRHVTWERVNHVCFVVDADKTGGARQ